MRTSAKIIADTTNQYGARITTFEVVAPRFLLAEINTHRVIAKSAASSRAIPVETRLAMVEEYPFVPEAFGKNKPGMQADENLTGEEAEEARKIWLSAAKAAAGFARKLANIGTHKQHANRLLEPFVYYTGVMTSTEWDNFWKLRTHADAQPEFRTLATQMLEIYDASRPKEDKFHLPYTDNCPSYLDYTALFKVAAARCARVSYKTFDGKVSTVDKDIKLCDDLIASGHLSPFDHPGEADSVYYDFVREEVYWANPADHRHNFGWIPHRVSVERQKGMVCARNSYAPLASKFDLTQAGA